MVDNINRVAVNISSSLSSELKIQSVIAHLSTSMFVFLMNQRVSLAPYHLSSLVCHFVCSYKLITPNSRDGAEICVWMLQYNVGL